MKDKAKLKELKALLKKRLLRRLIDKKIELHNKAHKEYQAAFVAVGARMWRDDYNQKLYPKHAKTMRKNLKDFDTATIKSLLGGWHFPLTVLDSYPEVRKDKAKLRQLEKAVSKIRDKYQALWDSAYKELSE